MIFQNFGFNQNYPVAGGTTYNYVSGAKVLYDIGNPSSYPGSGTTITNLGSAGSASDGTLVNGVAYSSTNGGILDFTKTSSQYVQFSTSVSSSFTTMAIIKSKSTSWPTGATGYNGFPNIRGTNGVIVTNEVSGTGRDVIPILWYGASATVPPGTTLTPASIDVFRGYSFTSNGTNSHIMYLDSGTTSAANTSTYTRGNSGTITSYIGRDAPNNGYLNGYMMAYLQYDRVLTQTEIAQNFAVFSARF